MIEKYIMVYPKSNTMREAGLTVKNTDFPDASELGNQSLDKINNALSRLQALVQNPNFNNAIVWGPETYSVTSSASVSSPNDDINDESYPDISTVDMIDFVIELKNFKMTYQQPNQLLPILEAAFLDITANFNQRRLWPDGIYYSTSVSGITVTLALEASDMSLSPASYLSQVSLVF